MFDGFMLREVSDVAEADIYIPQMLAIDPEWPPPDYDEDGLTFANDSFILLVQTATEDEVRDEVDYFTPDARGYFHL